MLIQSIVRQMLGVKRHVVKSVEETGTEMGEMGLIGDRRLFLQYCPLLIVGW